MKLNFDLIPRWFGKKIPLTDADLSTHATTVKQPIEELKQEEWKFDPEEQLSPHFKLKELVRTNHRELDNTPSKEVVDRLRILCIEFLEPLRAKFGPLYINSGYRSPAVNKVIKGSKTSAHMDGCAADIDPLREGVTTRDMVLWLRDESGLEYDQVIDEYAGATSNWLHLGMKQPNRTKPRRETLLFKDGKYTIFS